MQEHLSITNPEAARILTEGKSAQFLVPFIKRPLSLSDAAKELGVKLPKLSYHVKRFLTLGLLEVTATERRGGRSVKLYQSAAQHFSVPFYLTSSETLEQLVTELTALENRRFRRELARALQNFVPDWSFYVSCNESNSVSFSLKPDKKYLAQGMTTDSLLLDRNEPAIVSNEGRMLLDFDTAKKFQHDLVELYERYMGLQKANGQAYAFRLGITPMKDESLE